jgi:cytochrome P450
MRLITDALPQSDGSPERSPARGSFLQTVDDWCHQRRVLAPEFMPASINLLLPHIQAAGLHLLRSIGNASHVNLSKIFQNTALEVGPRALFSIPDNSARERLSCLMRGYIEGPGRPNLFDAFCEERGRFRVQ